MSVPPARGTADSGPSAREHRLFVLLLLFVALYLAYRVLQPFLHPIIFAAVLASLCAPLQGFLERALPGRRSLTALCVVVAAALMIVVPCVFLVSALVAEGVRSVNQVQEWVQTGGPADLLSRPALVHAREWITERMGAAPKFDFEQQVVSLSKSAGQALLNYGAGLLGNLATLLAQFLIMFFVMFYLVRDGADLIKALKVLSPLREDQEDRILERVRGVSRSVFLGSFVTAILQGIVGGIGLALVGIPGLFWGAVMGFTSLIPVVGTALVWVPAAGYLVLAGHWKAAVFLILWSIVLVSSIDSFLKPFLMRGPGGLSPFYVFLAVMGGLQYFGLPGLLYGPLVLGFAAVILYIYEEEFRPAR